MSMGRISTVPECKGVGQKDGEAVVKDMNVCSLLNLGLLRSLKGKVYMKVPTTRRKRVPNFLENGTDISKWCNMQHRIEGQNI